MMVSQYPAALAKFDFAETWLSLPTLDTQIDPFDFRHRMAVYKRIIDDSNAHGIFGADNQFNIFWGYVVQVFWQWRTHRLSFPHTPEGRIDPDSLWCYGNYGLSVIPLIGAMRAGLSPEMEILPPNQTSQITYVSGGGQAGPFVIPESMVGAVREWEAFFRQLSALRAGDDLEALRFKQWHAHHASLKNQMPTYERLGQVISRNEYDFFLGWIRMVDFLGTAAWRTDLDFMMRNGTDVLPERVFTDADVPGQIPDMSPSVNSNAANIIGLTRQSQWRFDLNLWMWKRSMRSRQARDDVLSMLDAVFNPRPDNASDRRKLLRYMLKF